MAARRGPVHFPFRWQARIFDPDRRHSLTERVLTSVVRVVGLPQTATVGLICLLSVPAFAQSQVQQASSAAEKAPQGFFSILFSGGLVGLLMLLVLFALSVTAAYLIFEHLMTVRRGELIPDGVSDRVRKSLKSGRVDEADKSCREYA